MSSIHVDETTGSDETGKGTPDQPYQSLAFALFTSPGATLLIRKDASKAYEEPTQSSLKKAKKTAYGLEKKRKKAEELAEREASAKKEERERREKQIEESKKIVLEEDASLPKSKKVCDWFFVRLHYAHGSGQAKIGKLAPLRGERVRVSGWVHRLLDQKGIIFVVLRDGTGYLQCILSGRVVSRRTRPARCAAITVVCRRRPMTL